MVNFKIPQEKITLFLQFFSNPQKFPVAKCFKYQCIHLYAISFKGLENNQTPPQSVNIECINISGSYAVGVIIKVSEQY